MPLTRNIVSVKPRTPLELAESQAFQSYSSLNTVLTSEENESKTLPKEINAAFRLVGEGFKNVAALLNLRKDHEHCLNQVLYYAGSKKGHIAELRVRGTGPDITLLSYQGVSSSNINLLEYKYGMLPIRNLELIEDTLRFAE